MTTSAQPIAEQAAVLNATVAQQLPADVLASFGEEQAALDAAGVPSGAARPGTAMPDGDLLDVHGARTTLAAARDGAPAVVVLYRGAWCPFCNIALRTYQAALVPALADRGVRLVAVSPQKPDGALTVQQTNELTFTVLSDPGNQLATGLGVLTRGTDAVHAAQAKIGVDVAAGNADGGPGVPMPTTVLVDTDGTIRWIDVQPNYTARTEPQRILDAVDALLG
ncbi:peroxiredoxin-like family protein [Streptantibioticus parmotrematis]|uniref:peroxiredoxin-like family protein n=1 Tax=Streptantibioticus parmotrematis TaxID=2873249 RepID=UPI0034007312